jgi:uncharacterized protein
MHTGLCPPAKRGRSFAFVLETGLAPNPRMKLFTRCLVLTLLSALAFPAAASAAPKKLLVVTVTTGFRHSCIPLSEQVLEKLATQSGQFTVEFVRQPPGEPKAPAKPKASAGGEQAPEFVAAMAKWDADNQSYQAARTAWLAKVATALEKLSPANLQPYDAVVFASTTGDLPLPDKQGFLDWVAAGHAFIGVHAATDTFHGFPPFIAMIGGEFLRHGPQVSVDCINQDPAHAATKPLPAKWTVFDEIYQFKNFERAKVHGLLTLDQHPNNKTPGDYPVSWCKSFGRGRVFYTSLGHREDVWDPTAQVGGSRKNATDVASLYQEHVLGGILWALGLAPGDAKPQAPN